MQIMASLHKDNTMIQPTWTHEHLPECIRDCMITCTMAIPAEKQPQLSSLSSSTVLDAVNISNLEV